MSAFYTSEQTGELQIDKILFESYYPVLFTCLDKNDGMYLCVCYQANADAFKWLLAKVRSETIIDLLSNKITIRDAFLKDRGDRYSIFRSDGQFSPPLDTDAELWDYKTSKALPSAGEYMDAEDGEFAEEIEYFKSKIANLIIVAPTMNCYIRTETSFNITIQNQTDNQQIASLNTPCFTKDLHFSDTKDVYSYCSNRSVAI